MTLLNREIQIISAPSVLGLKPSGVEMLSESLLRNGLAQALDSMQKVIDVDTLNAEYRTERDDVTRMLNADSIRKFSAALGNVIANTLANNEIPFVLGGDCSILIAAAIAMKSRGNHGLIFLDAHADFYEPEKSTTGEVADMDLAIVTGRGPAVLSDIDNLRPYVDDDHVIHVGQRDQDETKRYDSQDIRNSRINCFSLADLRQKGLSQSVQEMCDRIKNMDVPSCWIHLDLDVLSDDINPAVDYRIPDGLYFHEIEYIIQNILKCSPLLGVDVTIFNPRLDKEDVISGGIVKCLGRAFRDV